MNAYRYQEGIDSDRLTTRFLRPDDALAWSSFFATPETLEFLPDFGDTSNLERAQLWIERQQTRYREQRYGLQALFDKQIRELVGQCGLLLQEIDNRIELEVGYHLLREHWGKGYATESARAFIDYAFREGLAESIISIIDAGNLRSQCVAQRNGLSPEKRLEWRGFDVIVFRITA